MELIQDVEFNMCVLECTDLFVPTVQCVFIVYQECSHCPACVGIILIAS